MGPQKKAPVRFVKEQGRGGGWEAGKAGTGRKGGAVGKGRSLVGEVLLEEVK